MKTKGGALTEVYDSINGEGEGKTTPSAPKWQKGCRMDSDSLKVCQTTD